MYARLEENLLEYTGSIRQFNSTDPICFKMAKSYLLSLVYENEDKKRLFGDNLICEEDLVAFKISIRDLSR